jgi:Fic family protein
MPSNETRLNRSLGLVKRPATGTYETTRYGDETVRAFIPNPLPPKPPLAIAGPTQRKLERALLGLGRLDNISSVLPDTGLFLYTYVRKEAVLSSQIEGTQSSLSDLLLFELEEAPGAPIDDVAEVSGYVAALNHGLDRLRGGFPLSGRLIREMHALLLERGRGSDKEPGEFRRSQNWIGGTRPGNAAFVPPPPDHVAECMASLERFLNDDDADLPVLLRAGLAHVQFETIHPFLDGNGRIGRLLITLVLCEAGVLTQPLLYLSLYFKQNRTRYYDLLESVREDGDWEAWIDFFLEGVGSIADGAVAAARQLEALFAKDREALQELGRKGGSALRVHEVLKARPLITLAEVVERSGLSFPAAGSGMEQLEALGIAREITGRKRNRVFVYVDYLAVLNEGT